MTDRINCIEVVIDFNLDNLHYVNSTNNIVGLVTAMICCHYHGNDFDQIKLEIDNTFNDHPDAEPLKELVYNEMIENYNEFAISLGNVVHEHVANGYDISNIYAINLSGTSIVLVDWN